MENLYGLIATAFFVGYVAYYLGLNKGIDEGRLEGNSYGIAHGFLQGWIGRHSGEEIPEWVTQKKPPKWVVIMQGMYSNEEVVKWGAAVNDDWELSRLRNEEVRQQLNLALRNRRKEEK
jgi:hypothetical protein